MGNPNRSSISFLNHTFLNVPDFCGLRGAAPPKKNCATEKTVLPKMYFSTYYNDGFTLLLSALFKSYDPEKSGSWLFYHFFHLCLAVKNMQPSIVDFTRETEGTSWQCFSCTLTLMSITSSLSFLDDPHD